MDFKDIIHLYNSLFDDKKKTFKRSHSFGDYFTDRYERAKKEGFGKGSSVYDNVLIIGDVKVGENTWIGPNVILDGSGGLEIGDYCSISAGVQIYSHNTVEWANSLGKKKIDKIKTIIGNGVYIGPNSIVQMGVTIEDKSIIGAMSFVNKTVEENSKVYGIPAIKKTSL